MLDDLSTEPTNMMLFCGEYINTSFLSPFGFCFCFFLWIPTQILYNLHNVEIVGQNRFLKFRIFSFDTMLDDDLTLKN